MVMKLLLLPTKPSISFPFLVSQMPYFLVEIELEVLITLLPSDLKKHSREN